MQVGTGYQVGQENKDRLGLPFRVGVMILLFGIPLLIWQAFPGNQLMITRSTFLATHSMMEIFSVTISALIFFTAYGTRDTVRSFRVVVLGCAFLAAALFDTFHFLSYIGMPDFVSVNNPHKSILFWLAGRISAGTGLLLYVSLAESRFSHRVWARRILNLTLLVVVLITFYILYFPDVIPTMFIPGRGLTTIKVVLEWLVFAVYVGIAVLLYLYRSRVVNCDVSSLLLALLIMAIGELFFTMYTHVSNTANLLGHAYKVAGYYFLYRAIFAETVRQPFLQIQNMLTHDELTGLASRASFNEQLNQAIETAKRDKSSCAVILLGLDHFKTVNATLGHERGDMLLVSVAERIHSLLPKSAFIARFSGDMFSILLRPGSVEHASRLGKMLITAMEDEFNMGNDVLEIGASLGIVAYPQDGETASVLLRHADVSLHKAKTEGRNCQVVFSKELSEAVNRRALVESRLKHALEHNEFSLVYQPKVDLISGHVGGWEALLRWHSSELGVVSPMEFIPVAEESGLILQIGEWVIREACSQVNEWKQKGYDMGAVAVNLSARQFRQKDLPEKIKNIMEHAGVDASDITLEITESAIMDNPVSASNMLKNLAQLGIYAAIDDFGTGHSSLSYLKTFPIRWLKIDRSFIRDIPSDENDLAIVRSILGLGHSLGLKVVAEGVETEEQLAYLRTEHCDEIQGYYYSRPVSSEECVSLMQTGFGKS